jgi:hypothetical protein
MGDALAVPAHELFVLLSILLLLLAALAAAPWRTQATPTWPWSLLLGWAGMCAYVVSTIIGG